MRRTELDQFIVIVGNNNKRRYLRSFVVILSLSVCLPNEYLKFLEIIERDARKSDELQRN